MKHKDPGISRRTFLKASTFGIAAAGCLREAEASAGPLATRGGAASTVANSKLNLAVVGCGGQGRGVMSGMLSTGEVNLVALCDPDGAQIEQARSAAANNAGAAAKA